MGTPTRHRRQPAVLRTVADHRDIPNLAHRQRHRLCRAARRRARRIGQVRGGAPQPWRPRLGPCLAGPALANVEGYRRLPMVDGPGHLERLDPDSFTVRADQPGDLLVRVRYSSHWDVDGAGCAVPSPQGWTLVRAPKRDRSGCARSSPSGCHSSRPAPTHVPGHSPGLTRADLLDRFVCQFAAVSNLSTQSWTRDRAAWAMAVSSQMNP